MALFKKLILLAISFMATLLPAFAGGIDTLWTRSYAIIGGNTAVKFSSDGNILAVGTVNGEIRIYNSLTGDSITTFAQEQEKAIYEVSFSKNGNLVASGGEEGTIYVWDVKEKKKHKKILEENIPLDGAIVSLKFSNDGKRLYALHESPNRLYEFDANTFEEIKRIDLENTRIKMTISPDSKIIAIIGIYSGENQYIELRNAETLDTVNNPIIYQGDSRFIRDFDFSPDGSKIATAARDGYLRIWDVSTRKLFDAYLDMENTDNFTVRYINDSFLVTTPVIPGENSYFLFYDIKNKKAINRIQNKFLYYNGNLMHEGTVALDYNSHNNLIISVGAWGIFTLKTDSLTDVKDDNKLSIPISPNPSNGIVNLSLSSSQAENTVIKLFSSDGKEIKALFNGTLEGENYQFDTSNLSAGTYFLSVTTKTSSKTYKLVKE